MTESTTRSEPEKAALWEDFVDIFIKPSQVFERRHQGQFGLALLVLVVISTVLYFALRNGIEPITDVEISRQVAAMQEKNPNIPAEQLAGAKSMMEVTAKFATVIFIPIGVVLVAVLIWLAGKMFDAAVMFKSAMMIATYSQFPKILDLVLLALQGLLLEPEAITSRTSVSIGPGRFVDADASPVLATILGSLDLFTIWVFVLVAIGVKVVAWVPGKERRPSRRMTRAAIVSAVVWAVSLLPGIWGAINQS